MLSFGRRQIIDPEPLDLNQLLENVGELLERLLPENIAYEFLPSSGLGITKGDRGQIEQSVVNLAVNARDAMPDGGKLTITTENVVIDDSHANAHPGSAVGHYVLLRISDTGIGIPEALRERIFEPFFTTKSEEAGSGLGLSVTFGVIKQHHGFIDLSSDLGKGTEFRIYLPITEGIRPPVRVAGGASAGRTLDQRPVGGSETLLLVEDEEQVRNLVNTFLSVAGYTVLTAEDGEIGIETFRHHKDEISLVILDVVLPKLGGYEVMQEILKLAPETRVLFTTGYSEEGIHTNFILEDDLVLLAKPYRRDSLLSKVREMLDAETAIDADLDSAD